MTPRLGTAGGAAGGNPVGAVPLLLRLYAALLATAGAVLLFAPEASGATDARGLVLAQLVGAALLGFAALNWTARGVVLGGIYGRAVVVGNLAFSVVGALVLGRSLLNAPDLAVGALFGVLAFGAALYSVLLRRSPEASGTSRPPDAAQPPSASRR